MSAATNDPVVPPSTPLRLMAVHAHPDDESSKGAATMARYVREGVEVMVATLTGGERGDILNKAMERPEVRDLQRAVEAAHAELNEIVARFTGQGVQVKDMDRGLIDFPSEVDGQDALLCWQAGEERIAFWHSPQDGFAGRKPLE